MTIELITGRGGMAHVDSSDDGARLAHTLGRGCYVLEGCKASVVNANTVHIAPGNLLIEGRHVSIQGSGIDVSIENGSQSLKRYDLIVLRYAVGDREIETCTAEVVKGTPVSDDPGDPPHAGGSILAGDVLVEHPMYRIPINGLAPGTPVLLMGGFEALADAVERLDVGYPLSPDKGGTGVKTAAAERNRLGLGNTTGALPVANGGTGATTAAAARNALGLGNTTGALPVANGGTGVTTDKAIALKSWPVGSVYVSYSSTSPASLFGGTWTAITGVFPYFNAGTGTGGSNTHTLTTAQMPSHGHGSSKGGPFVGTQPSPVMPCIANSNNTVAYWYAVQTTIASTGGGAAHNNMPAYQTMYAWRRTA